MRVCEHCIEDLFEVEENPDGTFPGLTVVGAIIGGVAAAVTGSLVLVPLGVLAGFGGDIAVCAICGSDEGLHELMEQIVERDDHITFLPHKPPDIEMDETTDSAPQAYVLDEATRTLIPASEEVGVDDGGASIASSDWSIGSDSTFGDAAGADGSSSSTGTPSPGTGVSGGTPSAGSVGGAAGGGE
jgi:hypothetical protein